jgi:hypothetical protein
MQRVEGQARIEAPPAEVFAYLADLDNLAEWQGGIVSAHRVDTGEMRVGSSARAVRAADRQLAAITRLEAAGTLARLGQALRDTAATRRRMPDADLDTLASALGVSRSAVNHRLRRLVELATSEED